MYRLWDQDGWLQTTVVELSGIMVYLLGGRTTRQSGRIRNVRKVEVGNNLNGGLFDFVINFCHWPIRGKMWPTVFVVASNSFEIGAWLGVAHSCRSFRLDPLGLEPIATLGVCG